MLKKNQHWLILSMLIGLAALAGAIMWTGNSKVKTAVLKALPIPAVRVGEKAILAAELLHRYEAARIILKKEALDETDKQRIREQVIYESKLKILAAQSDAERTSWQNFIDLEKNNLPANQLLAKAAEAKARQDALRFWFYSQPALNAESYKKGEFLLGELKQGKDFGELARLYSLDSATVGLGGDLGAIDSHSLLFELKQPLLEAKAGETLLLPSRLGLHLVQVYLKKNSSEGTDVLYLKQIFMGGENFEEWVGSETKDYKIRNIIKL